MWSTLLLYPFFRDANWGLGKSIVTCYFKCNAPSTIWPGFLLFFTLLLIIQHHEKQDCRFRKFLKIIHFCNKLGGNLEVTLPIKVEETTLLKAIELVHERHSETSLQISGSVPRVLSSTSWRSPVCCSYSCYCLFLCVTNIASWSSLVFKGHFKTEPNKHFG